MSDTTPGPGAGAAGTAGAAGPAEPEAGDQSGLGRALAAVPAVLSSKVHILWLFVLLLWIVILAVPFPGIASARIELILGNYTNCLLYTSPSPRDGLLSRMPSSA